MSRAPLLFCWRAGKVLGADLPHVGSCLYGHLLTHSLTLHLYLSPVLLFHPLSWPFPPRAQDCAMRYKEVKENLMGRKAAEEAARLAAAEAAGEKVGVRRRATHTRNTQSSPASPL